MSINFSAGRFRAYAYLEAKDGDTTTIVQTHANGGDEVVARLQIPNDELEDLAYVLRRVLMARAERRRRANLPSCG